jgi:hypothetical protein
MVALSWRSGAMPALAAPPMGAPAGARPARGCFAGCWAIADTDSQAQIDANATNSIAPSVNFPVTDRLYTSVSPVPAELGKIVGAF